MTNSGAYKELRTTLEPIVRAAWEPKIRAALDIAVEVALKAILGDGDTPPKPKRRSPVTRKRRTGLPVADPPESVTEPSDDREVACASCDHYTSKHNGDGSCEIRGCRCEGFVYPSEVMSSF